MEQKVLELSENATGRQVLIVSEHWQGTHADKLHILSSLTQSLELGPAIRKGFNTCALFFSTHINWEILNEWRTNQRCRRDHAPANEQCILGRRLLSSFSRTRLEKNLQQWRVRQREPLVVVNTNGIKPWHYWSIPDVDLRFLSISSCDTEEKENRKCIP